MRLSLRVLFACTAICCFYSSASAQTGQLGGGGDAGGGGTTAQAGGTTQGLGGLTTQGPAGANAAANADTSFIGGFDPANGFVGGGAQTQRNNARQFQAITANGVPIGGTFATSGTPRQVPVSLRIGFSFPPADGQSQLIAPAGPAIQTIAANRPEFRSVQVAVSNGVAVLVGQVPTESSRRLAANLVRLRPGVRSVDNRIMIAQPAMTPRPVLPQ